jgi:2-desacetyl-2-hydroxyethyl bacteriochlorophyllide A dehydrogenase
VRERTEGADDPVTARAAVLHASRRLELETIELGPPAPGQLRVTVRACGICASNLNLWERGPRAGGVSAGAAGHEIAATVEAVGDGVTGLTHGDLVCVEPNLATACGTCPACRSGNALHCLAPAGLPTWGFADRMIVRAAGAIQVADQVPPERVSLIEPLACAVHALRRSEAIGPALRLKRPTRIAVIGAGALGLLTAFTARRLGAQDLGVVARYPHQAALAERVGATEILSADSLTDFRPDLLVVAAGGSEPQLSTAVDAVSPGGEVVVLGMLTAPQPFNLRRAAFREVRITFSMSYAGAGARSDFEVARDLLDNSDELTLLITHRRPLGSIQEAFTIAADREAGAIRVVVEPQAG